MKKTIITSALILGSAVASQAAVIAVIDGGGPTAGDSTHTTIADLSTGGDSIGTMTGSFSSDASDWRQTNAGSWNDTEWAFSTGTGTKVATYTFANMTVGSEWKVYGTWVRNANRAKDTPYTIQGGAAIDVNQEPTPSADLVLNDGSDHNFQLIGTATVNGAGEIVVSLSNDADEWVDIDAVAIKAVPEPSSAALLGLGGLALILRRRK